MRRIVCRFVGHPLLSQALHCCLSDLLWFLRRPSLPGTLLWCMSHDDVVNEQSVKGGETVELKVVDGNLTKAMRLMK
ncbi:hypothetical protein [uncultured Desulfuromonas sp.]|uniref:hypothetical protein n=1 Tax=uncultured Desulfuromonas sp. TaxID=181013 RepID=UPI002AAB8651|nr:hypothetical protein [uncultured Desulfuromonas sp.]